MAHLLPTLDDLRNFLQIPEINSGRRVQHLGFVFDDYEGLHAISDENGFIRLRSGVEMAICMYRGQVKEHVPCVPSLGRLKTVGEQLSALCRNAAFEEVIGEHPYVKIAERTTFLNQPLYIDKQGLAQHYGLSTDMLDVTSNFDVACFFAVCRWVAEEKRYVPVVEPSSTPGVIYSIIPCLLNNMDSKSKDELIFQNIGWQPLPRPEQQRACGIRLGNGQTFSNLPSVRRFCFRHDPDISERIWRFFGKGKSLFPADPAAILADQALRLESFTRKQVDRAWTRLETWLGGKFDNKTRTEIENHLDLKTVEYSVLSWDGLGVEKDENYFNGQLIEVLKRARYRLATYLAPSSGN